MLRAIRGCISLILYAANLLLLAAIIICTALFVLLLPKSIALFIQRHFLQKTPAWFAHINRWISLISTRNKWNVLGTGDLKKQGWYVMISNHRSWLDIVVLGNVFNEKIPPLKFFMKKELLWQLPLAGIACYALGYPFMSRHSHAAIRKNPTLKGQDSEATKKACNRLRHFPSTLINFLEGTRFTPQKKLRQQSPFNHLLKPHAGGASIVINELNDILSGIVSVTICYPKKTPSLWEFACGNFEKIIVRYDVLPITSNLLGDYYNDRDYRAYMQQYFNEIWKDKEVLLDKFDQKGE
ncbi:MAG: hypothetical protein ACD_42C00290G0005 [uncultured bacterium]|nr:MAG: hypothetical protein ACD_42C00290G0005 [uncultured bacterium]